MGSSRYRFIMFFMVIALLLTITSQPSSKVQQNDDRVAVAKKFIEKANEVNEKLHSRPRSERLETEYLTIISLYRQAVDLDQQHRYGDEALLSMAQLSEEIASYLHKSRYFYNSVEYYRQILRDYPSSPHQAHALVGIAKILENPPFDPQSAVDAYSEVIKRFPTSVSAREASANIARLMDIHKSTEGSKSLAIDSSVERQITGIRCFTGSDYARIVIDLSAPVTYEKSLMSGSTLALQLHEVKVLPQLLNQNLEIDTNGLLKDFHFQESEKGVRFNIKFDKIRDYAIFTINNPDRLMIDLRGKNSTLVTTPINQQTTPQSIIQPTSQPLIQSVMQPISQSTTQSLADLNDLLQKQGDNRLSLLRALGLKIKRIVIDAGHGGHDVGALGVDGLQEKDLVLDIAIRLREIIRQRLPEIDIVMTRDKDQFIPLEERTAIANAKGADLFISIHANSGQSLDASGVETYYLSINANKEELDVAARENSSTSRNARDLQSLLNKIVLEDKILESKGLADLVQHNLVTRLGKVNAAAGLDRGVKKAPFIVLIGANMPSVLSEISFLSNPQQAKLLHTEAFRQDIAESLFSGIHNYIDTLKKNDSIASK